MIRGAATFSALICLTQTVWTEPAHAENPLMRMKNAALSKVSAAQQKLTAPASSATKKGNSAKEIRDKWAVFIGVGQFEDQAITPLRFAFKNTAALADVFKNAGIGRFAPDHLVSIANKAATKESIEQTLTDEWLCKKALPEDLVVIYICTRFVPSDSGKDVMLLANDTKLELAASEGIPLSALLANIKRRLQSKRVVAFLDLSPLSQKSEGNGLDVEQIAANTGITILSATKGLQQSQNAATAPISSFTQYIVEGLNSAMGTLPLAAIASYVTESVNRDARTVQGKEQTPLFLAAADSPDIADVPLGVRLKSSIPEKPVHIGHPVDQLSMNRPDIMSGQPGRMTKSKTLLAQANLPSKEVKTAKEATGSAAAATKPPARPPARMEADDENDDDAPQQNVDFGPYMKEMKRQIQSKWTPPKGMQEKRVVSVFSIRRNGTIEAPTIVESSGTDSVDDAALAALKAASPLPKLPPGAPQFIQIRYQFDWKVKPTAGTAPQP